MTETTMELGLTKAQELVPLSIKDTVLAQFKEVETDLIKMADRYRNVAYDVTTSKGMAAAKAARADLRDNGRLFVTKAEKRIKDDVNSLKSVMKDEVDRLVEIVRPVEEAVDQQIKAEEARKAAEKAERERIEAERIGVHQANIDKLRSYVARAQGQPIDALEKAVTSLSSLTFGDEWEEFAGAAKAERDTTVNALNKMIETERQRAENARLAAELAAANELLAERERQEEAARKKAEEEAQATAKAQQEAEEAKAKAAKAEADRIKAEADAEAQRLESERLSAELAEANAAAAAQQVQAAQEADNPEAESPAPEAEAASSPVVRLSLNDLSEDEFKLLADNGGTITLGQINSRLKVVKIDAATLEQLSIITRRLRGAVHMEASDFPALCTALVAHILAARDMPAA